MRHAMTGSLKAAWLAGYLTLMNRFLAAARSNLSSYTLKKAYLAQT